MTTIAARIVGEKVKIAWDSQVTAGDARSHGMNKTVKINGQFAVGVAGYLRFANIVHRTSVAAIHPYDLKQPGFDGYAWILDELVPAWMAALRAEAENRPDKDDDIPWGRAIIALAGRIYDVGPDFSVNSVDDFAAVGSGASFAMAALHLGKSAKQAVEVAKELDMYTGGTIKEMTV